MVLGLTMICNNTLFIGKTEKPKTKVLANYSLGDSSFPGWYTLFPQCPLFRDCEEYEQSSGEQRKQKKRWQRKEQ